ncbi:rod shape-determining protein MreD [Neisseriaceae bacterium ESL0693]|nr:rod shape-determining protein MreD [Neisseriaceae bacterium ESL0693]
MTEIDNLHRHIRKRFFIFSLAVALLLDFIPFSPMISHWLPNCTALFTLYWALHRPQNLGIGVAFVIGLILDVGTATPLGLHALAYIFAVYVIQQNRNQILAYSYGLQSLAVLGALILMDFIIIIIHFFASHQFVGWFIFLPSFISALLWPLLSKLMLYSSQFRHL